MREECRCMRMKAGMLRVVSMRLGKNAQIFGKKIKKEDAENDIFLLV